MQKCQQRFHIPIQRTDAMMVPFMVIVDDAPAMVIFRDVEIGMAAVLANGDEIPVAFTWKLGFPIL